jgi:GH25 family lysozyme M1 (1,4-beta-N-acetylmuramidase)
MYDEKFIKNIIGAQKAGIKVGVYFFSQAITEEEAVEEANFVIKAISRYNITMPVAYDGEHVPDKSARTNKANLNNKQRTDIAIAFLDRIKSAGYIPMLYDNNSHLTGGFQLSRLDDYYIWYARYAEKPGFKYGYEMWQFTESGKIKGISGNVDVNVCMMNFPYLYMTKNGVN